MKLGLLTIGQSPRSDMTPEMIPLLGSKTEVVERGALDGLSENEIAELSPQDHDVTLITRLRDGSSVTVSKQAIVPLLEKRIKELEQAGVQTTIVVCTGTFPSLHSRRPLIFPDKLIVHVVQALPVRKLGVIIPLQEQRDSILKKWTSDHWTICYTAASPYHEGDQFERAAYTLKAEQPDMIVMDCMGYTGKQKEIVSRIADTPVVLSRTMVARVAGELLSE